MILGGSVRRSGDGIFVRVALVLSAAAAAPLLISAEDPATKKAMLFCSMLLLCISSSFMYAVAPGILTCLVPAQDTGTNTKHRTGSTTTMNILALLFACLLACATSAAGKDYDSLSAEEKAAFGKKVEQLSVMIAEGKKHGENKDWPKALKAFHGAAEFAPGAVDGYFYLASTYYAMGELEAATESYRKVAELMPKDAKAHSNLGVCLSDSGKHEEALKAHGQALELKPKDTGIIANAAKAHLARNTEDSVKEAAKHFKALLKIEPDNADAQMGLELAEMGVAKKVKGDYEIVGKEKPKARKEAEADEGVAA